jgi:hypothetical protein
MNMHLKNAMSSSADIVVYFHRPEYISTMNRLHAYSGEREQ